MFEEFSRIGKLLFQEGLVDAFGGSLSVRDGDSIFITKAFVMLGDLKKEDILEVGLEPGDKDKEASLELNAHRAVYKQSKTQAIVNAYPANAIAISLTDNKIVPQDGQGLAQFKAAPIVRVREGLGSEETKRLLPSFLNGSNVIAVVKGNGSFAAGQDLKEAYKYTSALENSCKIIVAMRASSKGQDRPERSSQDRGRAASSDRARTNNRRSAIPPGLGVMDRSRSRSRERNNFRK